MRLKHALIALAVVAAVVGIPIAVHAAATNATCTQSPVVSDTGTGQRITVVCTVPKPPPTTVTVRATATVTATVTASPTASPTAPQTPTVTPTPTPTSTPTATPTQPPAGEFPNESNTGPTGTLTTYTGPMTITAANTVIDSKVITGELRIFAANVTISNSQINGNVMTDDQTTAYSFTLQDSIVDAGDFPDTGVAAVNFTVLRSEVIGGNRGIYCWHDCVVRDSYVHGQMHDETGFYHESGIRMSSNTTLVHNTIACDAPDIPPDAGCSAPLTGYGDFAPVANNLIQANLFLETTGGFCAYGGSTGGKPYGAQAHDIRFIDNVFQRGTNPGQNGVHQCGYWGAITSWDGTRPGNQWSGNTWQEDGAPLQP